MTKDYSPLPDGADNENGLQTGTGDASPASVCGTTDYFKFNNHGPGAAGAQDAYFVRCDETTTTQSEVDEAEQSILSLSGAMETRENDSVAASASEQISDAETALSHASALAADLNGQPDALSLSMGA